MLVRYLTHAHKYLLLSSLCLSKKQDRINLWSENDDRLPVLSGSMCWRTPCRKHLKDSASSLSQITKMWRTEPESHTLLCCIRGTQTPLRVSHATMPVKNNLLIYEHVYRPAVLKYGMWDQVRVDHGREFYLTLYVQEMLSEYRHNLERQPYCQTQSTKNHTIEGMWPEISKLPTKGGSRAAAGSRNNRHG
nr:uncharacterized protein LOC111837619 isoform X2 [Paramormyrops kingsleyae]